MTANDATYRGAVWSYTATAVKATTMALIGGVLLTTACAPNVAESESDTSEGAAVAGAFAQATPQLTADQNRDKAMESIDNNSTMTPEQKTMAKQQLEAMGKKR